MLAIPLDYNNKPKIMDSKDNRLNSLDCGLEVNVCKGKLEKLRILAQSGGEDKAAPV